MKKAVLLALFNRTNNMINFKSKPLLIGIVTFTLMNSVFAWGVDTYPEFHRYDSTQIQGTGSYYIQIINNSPYSFNATGKGTGAYVSGSTVLDWQSLDLEKDNIIPPFGHINIRTYADDNTMNANHQFFSLYSDDVRKYNTILLWYVNNIPHIKLYGTPWLSTSYSDHYAKYTTSNVKSDMNAQATIFINSNGDIQDNLMDVWNEGLYGDDYDDKQVTLCNITKEDIFLKTTGYFNNAYLRNDTSGSNLIKANTCKTIEYETTSTSSTPTNAMIQFKMFGTDGSDKGWLVLGGDYDSKSVPTINISSDNYSILAPTKGILSSNPETYWWYRPVENATVISGSKLLLPYMSNKFGVDTSLLDQNSNGYTYKYPVVAQITYKNNPYLK